MIRITRDIVLQDSDVKERFVRASGPGGQNVNKDATAVELRVDIGKSSLPPDVKQRLIAFGGKHVTTDDVLVIVGRVYRSQAQNREAALALLVGLLRRAAKAPKKRTPTRPRAAVREKRMIEKERQSAVKRARSGRDED